MAKSELEKVLAATDAKGSPRHGRPELTRLMAEVLRLTHLPRQAGTLKGNGRPVLPPSLSAKPVPNTSEQLLSAASAHAPLGPAASVRGDLGSLAARVAETRRAATPPSVPVAIRSSNTRSNASSAGGSFTGIPKLLSTFLGGSGLGSVVSGLLHLFGGGQRSAPLPLYKFSVPQSISVEAAVTRSGQFVPINHSQSGQARLNAELPPIPPALYSKPVTQASPYNAPPERNPSMAVDGRWFMDHSDDIASAVREAMLHSHSINDVVTDL